MTVAEMREALVELIEEVINENHGKEGRSGVVFTDRAKEIIKDVSAYAKTTAIWEEQKEQREQFWEDTKDATPELIYGYMIDRVANAPFQIFADCSVILIMPKLDEVLNGEKEGESDTISENGD